MPPAIPDRAPLGDSITGTLVKAGNHHLLLIDQPPANESGVEIIARGEFIIRYGVRYLGKPHLSVVPGLLALDYGDILTGEEAWDFLWNRSNLYPRSDIIGYRNDGLDEMIPIKKLDLALPPEVLLYEDAAAAHPLVSLRAIIAAENIALPQRLRQYLPRYDSLAAWQAAHIPTDNQQEENR